MILENIFNSDYFLHPVIGRTLTLGKDQVATKHKKHIRVMQLTARAKRMGKIVTLMNATCDLSILNYKFFKYIFSR